MELNRTLIIDFDFPASQKDDSTEVNFKYYHKVKYDDSDKTEQGAALDYYNTVIQK